jgi:hypothetical protein
MGFSSERAASDFLAATVPRAVVATVSVAVDLLFDFEAFPRAAGEGSGMVQPLPDDVGHGHEHPFW